MYLAKLIIITIIMKTLGSVLTGKDIRGPGEETQGEEMASRGRRKGVGSQAHVLTPQTEF